MSRNRFAVIAAIGTLATILASAALAQTPERIEDTLGAPPPEGAAVLFEGANTDAWCKQGTDDPIEWKLVEEGAMEVFGGSATTREHFEDCQLHLEFWEPLMPNATGQARGNSGVYLQGSYEVQVLDSYDLAEIGMGDCGSIYGVSIARVNACQPPEEWQTYDITFRAPRFDPDGNLVEQARVTVYQNGILIQDNVEIPGPTTAAMDRDVTQPGPLMLQDHGCPVRYRNVWLVPVTLNAKLAAE